MQMRLVIFIAVGLALFTSSLDCKSQVSVLDSLNELYSHESTDTGKAKVLDKIGWYFVYRQPDSAYVIATRQYALALKANNPSLKGDARNIQGVSYFVRGAYDSALFYFRLCKSFKEEASHKKGVAFALNNMAVIYEYKGENDSALNSYMLALKYRREVGDTKGVGMSLNNIGLFHYTNSRYSTALEYFFDALKVKESIGDSASVAATYTNIAMVYRDMKSYNDALKYHLDALRLRENYGTPFDIAASLSNVGAIYESLGKSDQALENYNQSLKISREIGYKVSIGNNLMNIATVLKSKGQLEDALKMYKESVVLKKEIGDNKETASALANVGMTLIEMGKSREAVSWCEEGKQILTGLRSYYHTHNVCKCLYTAYKALGNDKKALQNLEIYEAMEDSIDNEEHTKEITQRELEYQFSKQQIADSLKVAEHERITALQHEKELEKKQTTIYASIAGLLIVLVMAIILFRGYRQKQKANLEITKQKELVEYQKNVVDQKNKEITDSITYAKRIQEAILPPVRIVKQWLSDSFILYKPKDIVAGDFYWMETIGDTVFFAAADCTGHGVPGAMVSVVCANALSKSLIEENNTDPGKLLDRTRELVVDRFGRSEEEIKDGMDVSICALNLKTNELNWAGANNPLWLIRNGSDTIEEIKGDKQPIGKYAVEDPFTSHHLQLEKGDTIYIFSDGYADQFGGDKGKKFKSGQMKEFFLSIKEHDMQTQRQLLNEKFEAWRGDLQQIDDVCIIGVRV